MRARRAVRAELAQRPPVPDGTVEIAVYFTDGPENLYQIDQWFEPLRRLHERHHVTVLSRNWETTRELLRRCPVPVHHAPSIDEVEAFIAAAADPGDALREPEPGELLGDALRRPLARLHLPRRVRQGLHVEQPAQGLRPGLHRRHGCARADPAQADRVRRAAPHRGRPPPGRRRLPRAVAAARRPHGGALRPHLGGRPGVDALLLGQLARPGDGARAGRPPAGTG